MLRQLGDRAEAVVRRELDRLFAARPDLTEAQRAAIARAMSRFRNQLLHHPRSALRAAADAGDTADPHPLLDAARRVFGLADAPPANQVDPRRPGGPSPGGITRLMIACPVPNSRGPMRCWPPRSHRHVAAASS